MRSVWGGGRAARRRPLRGTWTRVVGFGDRPRRSPHISRMRRQIASATLALLLILSGLACGGEGRAPQEQARSREDVRLYLAGLGEVFVVDVETERAERIEFPALVAGDPSDSIERRENGFVNMAPSFGLPRSVANFARSLPRPASLASTAATARSHRTGSCWRPRSCSRASRSAGRLSRRRRSRWASPTYEATA